MTDQPIRIFIAYARKDNEAREKLREQLSALERRGHFQIFWDGLILPGERWDTRLKDELHRADIFLLLVSEAFLDSDYVHEVELPKALQLRAEGKAEVLPVILRRCLWQHTELNDFQCILCEGKPIETAPDGFAHVAEQVVETVNAIKAKRRAAAQAQIDAEADLAAKARQAAEAAERAKTAAREEAARKKREADVAAEAQRAKEVAERKRKEQEAEQERLRKLDPFHDLMLSIKGGSFDMGDTFGDGFPDEKPGHRVTVPDFLLCKYPVTQAQWKQIMGTNPSHFKGDDLPVEQVNWDDAQGFLKKLIDKTGRKYRLPTEAEWEYAAKGGTQSKGYKYAGSNDLDEVGWHWENSGDKRLSGDWSAEKATQNNCRTHPVGQKKPNELGLYDMSGNVWEWVEDDWHGDYKGNPPTNGSAWVDGPERGLDRVLRGGSWLSTAQFCRSASHIGWRPDDRDHDIGFRFALSL